MNKNRFYLLIPALIPLLLKWRYFWYAWQSSPLDRFDWIFLPAAVFFAALRFRSIRSWISETDWRGLLLALPALLAGLFFAGRSLSVPQIAAGMLFFFSMLLTLGGSRLFTGCLPLLPICLLACPSTSYWTEYYLRILLKADLISGFVFKLIFGTICAAFFLLLKQPLKLKNALYLAGLALLTALLFLRSSQALFGDPAKPDLQHLRIGAYIASSANPTPLEIRFFEGSRLIKTDYYGDQGQVIHLLSVEVTGDVHKLHPTELCLKSKRISIRGLNEKIVNINGTSRIAIQELEAVHPEERYLIYTWYSGPHWSTGNFFAFRKNWNTRDPWQSFQLMTRITTTKQDAENRLMDFLKILINAPPSKSDI